MDTKYKAIHSQLKNSIIDYFNRSATDYQNTSKRYWIHIQILVAFAIPSFLMILFTPRPLTFKLIYPSVMVLCYCGVHFLLSEWLVRAIGVGQGQNPLTLKRVWNVALVSYGLGYFLYRLTEYELVPFYYKDASPDLIGSEWVLFFRMLPYWLLSIFCVTWFHFKNNSIPFEIQEAKKIQAIDLRISPSISIDTTLITHITVEEHYSRIFYKEQGSIKDLQIRSSLQEVFKQLPQELFIKIHRSHIASLLHIQELKNVKYSYEISIGDNEFLLPVSRRRIPDIVPQIKEFLAKNTMNRIILPKSFNKYF